ncbi:HNH endonuclease signature motif containing protein [Jiangella asiatica]|uniref:HNH endonuclease n=1 Tax=Jiangella asiatica TaxID=2530372 RepID=A0A4R5D816_9ACTN|nr:HNH endonuclease [Jiangella asiatica]
MNATVRTSGVLRLAKRRGRAATVLATVPVTALAGADDQPGWLDGYGPITATTARRIAADATLRRLLTDPTTGEVLEYGHTTYTPPAALAAFVTARDATCRFPTCARPATETDIDHQIPYHHGGTTGAANTWALHRTHHLNRTHHGHTIHTTPTTPPGGPPPPATPTPPNPRPSDSSAPPRTQPAPHPSDATIPLPRTTSPAVLVVQPHPGTSCVGRCAAGAAGVTDSPPGRKMGYDDARVRAGRSLAWHARGQQDER